LPVEPVRSILDHDDSLVGEHREAQGIQRDPVGMLGEEDVSGRRDLLNDVEVRVGASDINPMDLEARRPDSVRNGHARVGWDEDPTGRRDHAENSCD
jgi:hypothetical protein